MLILFISSSFYTHLYIHCNLVEKYRARARVCVGGRERERGMFMYVCMLTPVGLQNVDVCVDLMLTRVSSLLISFCQLY